MTDDAEGTAAEDFFRLLAAVRSDRRSWSGAAGRELLATAQVRLTGVAAACNADVADAVAVAWETWSSGQVDHVENPWAYTAAVVRRRLGKFEQAQRLMTSGDGLRRHGDEARGTTFAELTDHATSPASVDTAASAPPRADLRTPGAIVLRQLLVAGGLSAAEATELICTVLDSASQSSTMSAASDRLCRDSALAERFGLSHSAWRAAVTLAIGTTRGQPGVVELVHRGHPAPAQVTYIRRASRRLAQTEAA